MNLFLKTLPMVFTIYRVDYINVFSVKEICKMIVYYFSAFLLYEFVQTDVAHRNPYQI